MKNLLIITVLSLICLTVLSQNIELQKTYVNLEESVLNLNTKPGWGEQPISDEFKDANISNPYSGSNHDNPNLDMLNEKWHWCPSWAMAHYNSPHYCKKDNIETTVYSEDDADNYIKIWTKYEPDGFEHPDLGYYNSPRYPVRKNYSSIELNSNPVSVETNSETVEIFPANGEFKYGYFEIRCRLPKGKFLWPAFWLFTGEQSLPAIWNEIDIFESGINDQMLLSNHFRSNGIHYAPGKWVYALPGQSFSNTWITYALKWEPNKLVWYINNKPVKIIKDIDTYTDPVLGGSPVQVIIPQTEMCVIIYVDIGKKGWNPNDWYLEETSQAHMDIDYIRVYQRPDHTLPDPYFSINGIPCGNDEDMPIDMSIDVYSTSNLKLNASESYMPDHKYKITVEHIEEPSGNIINSVIKIVTDGAPYYGAPYYGQKIDVSNINLNMLCDAFTLDPYNYYKITVADNSGYTSKSQLIHLVPCSYQINFTVNGNSPSDPLDPVNIDYNNGKTRIVIVNNESQSYQNTYHIYLVPCNQFGTPTGTGIDATVNDDFGTFDIDHYCTNNGFNLTVSSYYKITMTTENAIGNAISSYSQLIYIQPCTQTLNFTLNEYITGGLKEHSKENTDYDYVIDPGKDIILDGSMSVLCTNCFTQNDFTMKIQNNNTGEIIQALFDYCSYGPIWSYWYQDTPGFSIGRFDIRKFCKEYSMCLTEGELYTVTLSYLSNSLSKTFYLKPYMESQPVCDFHIYRFNYYCGGPVAEYFLPCEDIFLYSPDEPVDMTSASSYSYDRSFTITIKNELSNKERSYELTPDEVYQLKIIGALDLIKFEKDHYPDLPPVIEIEHYGELMGNRTYMITLKNYTSNTLNCLPAGHSPSEYFGKSTKIINIVPKDISVSYYCDTDEQELIIDANTTLSGRHIFNRNVRIASGNTFTITGEAQFNKNAKVIIEPGATLIVDGGKLTHIYINRNQTCNVFNPENTNLCNDLWQGIELWGNRDESQYISGAQGKIILKNGAIIENAIDAIRTIKTIDGIDDWNYTGGIIQANNATFRNNKNGIWFGPYHNSHPFTGAPMANAGDIKNCTFETTDDYIDISNPPYEFIGLYDIDGISIYGNTFRNTNTDYTGNGIMSYDASYNVKPLCSSLMLPCPEDALIPNTFENLYYGIYASNTNPAIPLTIDGNKFINTSYAIILRGINNATVTKNSIDVGYEYDEPIAKSFGIYLEHCSGYKVEENNFFTTHTGKYGIVVNNSGTNANEVYNNTFNDLIIGSQAQGKNANTGALCERGFTGPAAQLGYSGLQFLCNQYSNVSISDIAVTSGRIALYQGYCNNDNPCGPAGNKFSHTCNTLTSTGDISVNPDASSFYYNHHSNPGNYIPLCYNFNKVTLNNCFVEYHHSCPSHLISGLTLVALKEKIKTGKYIRTKHREK